MAQQLDYVNMFKQYKHDILHKESIARQMLRLKKKNIQIQSEKQRTILSISKFSKEHNINPASLRIWLQHAQLGYFWLTQKYRPDIILERTFHHVYNDESLATLINEKLALSHPLVAAKLEIKKTLSYGWGAYAKIKLVATTEDNVNDNFLDYYIGVESTGHDENNDYIYLLTKNRSIDGSPCRGGGFMSYANCSIKDVNVMDYVDKKASDISKRIKYYLLVDIEISQQLFINYSNILKTIF